MAQITITIPNPVLDRVLVGFTNNRGYQATTINSEGQSIPNPVTRAEYSKQQLIQFIKECVISYEGQIAAAQAASSTALDVTTNITIT